MIWLEVSWIRVAVRHVGPTLGAKDGNALHFASPSFFPQPFDKVSGREPGAVWGKWVGMAAFAPHPLPLPPLLEDSLSCLT
ncbi:MAG TPA: hypothetical protein VF043_05545 [Ktedonobacteraceae bacterium]